MKKLLLFPALGLCLLFSQGCKKKNKDPEPEPVATPSVPSTPTTTTDPYTYSADLQSAKDMAKAFYMVADIEMTCAFLGEQQLANHFYAPIPSTSNTVSVVHDAQSKYMFISYSNTPCRDGKMRDGTLMINYSASNPNAALYRQFGYQAKISFANYVVDGWKVEALNTVTVENRLLAPNFNPAQTNLAWSISGKLKLTNVLDTSKKIIWDGILTKVLINTGNPNVFNTAKQPVISWNLAKVNYVGKITGSLPGNIPYSFTCDSIAQPQRDFNCAFVPLGSSDVTEFHPFTLGKALFKFSNVHPRTLVFGPTAACDNEGSIFFSNETHAVTFDF